jgi:hypothetical protein
MNKEFDNESGVAYVWFMILALLILGAIMWMSLSYTFNLLLIPINVMITNGTMSTQTADPIAFNMALLGSVPIFLIIGSLVWAILAAVNRED